MSYQESRKLVKEQRKSSHRKIKQHPKTPKLTVKKDNLEFNLSISKSNSPKLDQIRIKKSSNLAQTKVHKKRTSNYYARHLEKSKNLSDNISIQKGVRKQSMQCDGFAPDSYFDQYVMEKERAETFDTAFKNIKNCQEGASDRMSQEIYIFKEILNNKEEAFQKTQVQKRQQFDNLAKLLIEKQNLFVQKFLRKIQFQITDLDLRLSSYQNLATQKRIALQRVQSENLALRSLFLSMESQYKLRKSSKMAKISQQKSQLQKQLSDEVQRGNQLESLLIKSEDSLKILQQEFQTLNAKLVHSNMTICLQQNQAKRSEEFIASIEDEKNALIIQLNSHISDNLSLKEKQQNVQIKNKARERKIDLLYSELHTSIAESRRLQQTIEHMAVQFQSQKAESQKVKTLLESQMQLMHLDMDDSNRQISNFTEFLSNKETRIMKVQSQIDYLKSKFESRQKRKQNKISKQLQKECAVYNAQSQSALDKYRAILEIYAALHKKYEILQDENAKLVQRLTILENEKSNQKNTLGRQPHENFRSEEDCV